ncbi:MAG TPA: hypothetical protein PKE12_14710 [Kiritimatiellia bacterium]|nr:hypothetical protein [Kiritimatiellia bacterium]
MITSRILAGALLALAWTGLAEARLGENQLQHEQRYGRSEEDKRRGAALTTTEPNTVRTYHYEGWRLVVTFRDGIAHRKEYWKTGPQEHEVEAILRAESGGGTWTQAPLGWWVNSNGRVLTRELGKITVKTAAEIQREKAEEAARKKLKPAPTF